MGRGVSVVIADAQPLIRAGLRAVIESAGMSVLGEADCVDEMQRMGKAIHPDVCLVDLDLPGGALGLVRWLAHEAQVPVVVIAGRHDEGDVLEVVQAGARGFVVKDGDVDHLPRAVEAVLSGEAAIPRRLVSRLLNDFQFAHSRHAIDPALSLLTRRELEILGMLRSGMSTSAIAAQLFVAPVTVRTHVCAILRKLKLPDRQALLREARDKAVVRLPRPRDRVRAS